MTSSLPGSLWRICGSSMAVYMFQATALLPFRPLIRDRILSYILLSQKHSSLQKHGPLTDEGLDQLARDADPANDPWACIIGRPGDGDPPFTEFGLQHLPYPLWADAGQRDAVGTWDVICSIAQVKKREIDFDRLIQWSGESSEVLAAVAHSAVSSAATADPIIPHSHLSKLVQEAASTTAPDKSSQSPVFIPVRILLTHTERVVVVHVPVDLSTMAVVAPLETYYSRYATHVCLPNAPVAVEPEVALEQHTQLPTGRASDTISVPGHGSVDVSIVQPLNDHVTILVDQCSAPPACDGLASLLPDDYNKSYPELASFMLDTRNAVLSAFPAISDMTSTPSICLVGSLDHDGSSTVDGRYLCCCMANLSVRALTESGGWDDTLPEPILLALAAAQGLKGSVPYKMWLRAQSKGCGGGRAHKVDELLGGETVHLSAAYPSGVLAADVKFSNTELGRRATEARLQKIQFELMRGEFFFPPDMTQTEENEEEEYEREWD